VDLQRKRTGCPWSIDLPHGTRQSIVPWDSLSLSRTRPCSILSLSLPPSLPPSLSLSLSLSPSLLVLLVALFFFASFLRRSLVPPSYTIVARESRMAGQVEGAAGATWTMRFSEIAVLR